MTSKSCMKCRSCNIPNTVIRLLWTDYYPEGHRHYDDHVCLECGLYANGGGVSLSSESLAIYQKKYGDVLAAGGER